MLIARKNPQTGETHVIMTGIVCKDSKYEANYGGKTTFSVKYGSMRDESGKRADGLFFNCCARRAIATLAACLEKGDSVLVCGVVTSREYTSLDGQRKTWTELECDFLLPQPQAPVNTEESDEEAGEHGLPGNDGYEDYCPSI